MSGMGDGYVGTSQDGVRIRRLQKQREAERRKIQELKSKTASGQEQSGLLQFGSSSCEILDTAFKKETVGLVTREEYVEKRVNIRNKFEEEEKEKLQKLLQEEEELQQQKRNKKRKIKGSSRLSFAEDLDDDSDADDGENTNLRFGKLGKDPSVETNFLPDSEREAEEQAERERLKKQWTREQEQIKNEPLQITYSYWDGTGHRRVIQVRKGDAIGNFLRAVQQQLAPDFREIRTTSVENLLYVKEDLIIPHCMGATSLERRCEIAVAILSERPHRSDVVKSLWLSSQSDLIGAISVRRSNKSLRASGATWMGRCERSLRVRFRVSKKQKSERLRGVAPMRSL
ncbi:protein XAP5 CIRCADIAN TIMEKEEPER isoform X2 [Brassica rapa]|uniref:protein XAP5 CIRCADIAN TIMEKEEPER isoform X1 n=1 Tax=Brassica campestris TaxID=3711 RepID=UPI0004F18C77|nr:protein XAP5 CIRCADIAN TIMEKEEPER isoform X1 [Brassica rapa]XP_033145794.1 protein XAP5 CIRCADIAN TIMEKEEPER isoform X2 [Brassica rapa]